MSAASILESQIIAVEEHLISDLARVVKQYLQGLPNHIYQGALVHWTYTTYYPSSYFANLPHCIIKTVFVSLGRARVLDVDVEEYKENIPFISLSACNCSAETQDRLRKTIVKTNSE